MFETLPALAPDPILGLTLAYQQDTNPHRVDLGAGVYKNAQGHTPIMQAVQQAQHLWLQQEQTKAYVAPVGFSGFNRAMQRLLLGEEHPVVREQRVSSVQTPGGCGALRLAAGLLMRCQSQVRVWVSTPTWANHVPLLGSAGIELLEYPYYDADHHQLDFDAMMAALAQVTAGDLVLLHGCCHNPSGADLNREQWRAVTALLVDKGATPFIDMAYQGLGEGVQEDAWGLRYMAEHCPEMVIASSCSKNFGLYRERVGAVLIIAKRVDQACNSRDQLTNIAREIYSMPPSHGAALVDLICHSDTLLPLWQQELAQIRQRIVALREQFVNTLEKAGLGERFAHIQQQRGMFSFLGIDAAQVQRLQREFSIYMADSSRVNIAGLNSQNMAYITRALLQVI